MPTTADIRQAVQTLYPDNISGLIEAVDVRDGFLLVADTIDEVNQGGGDEGGVQHFVSLSALLAHETPLAVGSTVITEEGYAYTVDSTTAHLTTAGGSNLRVKQLEGVWSFGALNPAGDGVTNDRPKFVLANAIGGQMILPAPAVRYQITTPLVLTMAVDPAPRADWQALTNNGMLTWKSGSQSPVAQVRRLADRVFVGAAASEFAGQSKPDGTGDRGRAGPFTDRAAGPAFVPVNSQLVVEAHPNQYAVVGMAQTSRNDGVAGIGVSGVIYNDKEEGRGWCLYADYAHRPGALVTNGLEIAAKNQSGVTGNYSPYVGATGAFGIRMGGGGDASYGGPANAHNTAALLVMRNSLEGNIYTWRRGIIFTDTGLVGTDGSAASNGLGEAIVMARRHALVWYAPAPVNPDGARGATLMSSVLNGSNGVTQNFIDRGVVFTTDDSGIQFLRATAQAGAINYPHMIASAGDNPVIYSAQGEAADIHLRLAPKGAGRVQFGTYQAQAGLSVIGYITIRDDSGNARRLAIC